MGLCPYLPSWDLCVAYKRRLFFLLPSYIQKMSSRVMFHDARWFSDNREQCVIENEWRTKLHTGKDDVLYSQKLQESGESIFSQVTRKEPKIQVKNIEQPSNYW
jgi:hypothetical protein